MRVLSGGWRGEERREEKEKGKEEDERMEDGKERGQRQEKSLTTCFYNFKLKHANDSVILEIRALGQPAFWTEALRNQF